MSAGICEIDKSIPFAVDTDRRIIEIDNPDTTSGSVVDRLDQLCEERVRRRGRRGRPKGSGRKHPEKCQPKTFRHFSPLSHGLLWLIRLGSPENRAMTESEVVEEALVRLARALSNENPRLADRLRRAGR